MRKALAVFLMVPALAHAGFWSGNSLLTRMNGDQLDRMMALGYVMGISDALEGIVHCSGSNVTNGQSRDIVKLYLERNPSIRDQSAELLTSKALQDAFPCKKGKSL